jgi:hypothetical protein
MLAFLLQAALDRPVTLDVETVPLSQAVAAAGESARVRIDFDAPDDSAATLRVRGVTLRTALRLLLADTGLTVVDRAGTLTVAPRPVERMVTKVYDVRDSMARLQEFPVPGMPLIDSDGLI